MELGSDDPRWCPPSRRGTQALPIVRHQPAHAAFGNQPRVSLIHLNAPGRSRTASLAIQPRNAHAEAKGSPLPWPSGEDRVRVLSIHSSPGVSLAPVSAGYGSLARRGWDLLPLYAIPYFTREGGTNRDGLCLGVVSQNQSRTVKICQCRIGGIWEDGTKSAVTLANQSGVSGLP